MPIEETMQAPHVVVKAGYVRYIGMSSCNAYQIIQMQNYAITHNLTPFISMQNRYSLMYHEEEREMFPTLKMFSVGSFPWLPPARGLLSRPNDASSKRGDTDPILARYKTEANLQVVDRVEELAKKKGVKMAQVALAWIFAKPGVSAPIIGTTNLSNLEELLGALDIKLSEEEVKYLEEPYKPMVVVGAL
ncbi:Aldo/keto reductase [Trametes versicolor FP-101664 SS1]|uniref:Aldo/keto reductase n=1 Tax=Trametes versicolor (strain FP-101664) TaxID=717944 RepID=UPI0004621C3D|nr:Aldo/keto reductase [Trametes versicolor FP-101664 SS1]EIW54279.1 Aldo/keto reductase [Trametes versicolor FP-101664 SS1]